jgi:site-specific DNA-cytosine methylase
MVIHSIELCAGVGMLGEGVRAALEFYGWQHRTVAYVERETAAAAQLVALMGSECLDAAPIWPDLTTFDGAAWRGKVDCVIAGFPCQDMSVAGKRVGLDGARSGLFFNVCQIADDCGAWLLILENVAGIASATASVVDEAEGELDERAASRVVGELADRGWDAEWLHLSASDVGASHGRERWFCFAWRMGNTGLQHQHIQQREDGAEHSGAGNELADTNGIGRWAESNRKQQPGGGLILAAYQFSRPAQPLPSGQGSSAHRLGSRPRLNPAFACWLMGWPSWWTNPGITNCAKSEMESYRFALRQQLLSLCGEQE